MKTPFNQQSRLLLQTFWSRVCAIHCLFGILCMCSLLKADDSAPLTLSAYNVVWDSPSENQHGSMPIGNGDLAANVWVEPNGDLIFYLSKGDAWSGEQNLLKLGRVRVRFDAPLVVSGSSFQQTLDMEQGRIVIRCGAAGVATTIIFWIDANQSVVNVEVDSSKLFEAEVTLETWRTADAARWGGAEPDTVLPSEGDTIRWFQRNTKSIFAESFRNQHLGDLLEGQHDPLMHLTFGGLIAGNGLESSGASTLVSAKPQKQLLLRVHALTEQSASEQAWIQALQAQREAVASQSLSDARQAHAAWWSEFWSRSHIFVGSDQAEHSADAYAVSQAYVLQRWVQAGAGRGAYPIKFNGSLFTVDSVDQGKEMGPDYRRWGGCYWFQNTREPYWAMLYSGDSDQMEPLWKMYREAVPMLKERTRKYFDHEGIFCSETIYPWGLNQNHDFGIGNPDVIPTNPYIRYYWDSGIELSMMMLEAYAHTQDSSFVEKTLLPIADEVLKFYDQHYERNADGQIHFTPAMSLETWHEAEDPLPVIVGLRTVITKLLDLPDMVTTADQRERWQRVLGELPPVPFGEADGQRWIEPARSYSDRKNSENPELYAVFPYRAYGVGKPDLDVALTTWERRGVKRTGGWSQDAIQAALLGLTAQAQAYVIQNATEKAIISKKDALPNRFPAFWGPNFDWTPDQCQGSVTMIALQRMLMQCEDQSIRLLPAWPEEWDVTFKLHAPYNTTVEGRVVNGELVNLVVTPESRRADVILMHAQR